MKNIIESLLKKTVGSRRYAEGAEASHVDKSSIAFGATSETKFLSYPFVIESAKGARVRDIDGNEYIDILQGLGANLFGHGPEFVRAAVAEQMEKGFPLGAQTPLVKEVAELITELTGMPKVCFSNTGTEAIMTAIRVARAKTGRSKIVIFSDAYHGHVDWVIMRQPLAEFARRRLVEKWRHGRLSAISRFLGKRAVKGAAPASVGIPSSIAKDVIVLPYGSEKSLKVIRSLRSKLAAVLVEPVQSRRPELQPREFLKVLREITREGNVGLIFDEMVTGFRIHPGGAQAYFGVEADLVTYSKIAGGGLPLSVLAGRGDFMSYLAPMAGGGRDKTVFFAGTFCKHPLSIAASYAVMSKLKEEGPKLQEELNQRSALMVKKLNDNLKEEGIPVIFTNFGSFFSIALSESDLTPDDVNYLSCYLQDCGIYLRGGDKGGFLTTAHSDADVKAISKAFLDGLRLIFDNKNSLKK